MLAFKREAVAQQTQESRLQQLLLLQHLKRSRRKRLILLQIALRKTRRVRRAWSWPRNQFWFEALLNGNFVEEWWKENFRISRCTFEYIVRLVGPDLAKKDTRLRECIPVNKRVAVALWRLATYLLRRPKPDVETWSKTWAWKRDRMSLTQSRHHRMWNSMRPQADVSVIQTLVTDLNHACSQSRPNFYLS